MRKILLILLAAIMTLSLAACGSGETNSNATTFSDSTTAESVDSGDPGSENEPEPIYLAVEQWTANEICFVSDKTYADPVYSVVLDVVFTSEESRKKLIMPAFWDGEANWKVRFALTEPGLWDFTTVCSETEDGGLNGQHGTVTVTAYSGDLDIYKHGFVRDEKGKRYFVYDDGTPFFYLGDTHWTLPVEEMDGIGSGITQETADENGITSQFKYIMDYRAEQGYTVIQSQQLGWYEGATGNSWLGDAEGSIFDYGVTQPMLEKFQQLDEYFAYIAKKGLVHAHTQFAYPEELIETYLAGGISDNELEMLCRYWAARYAAYPVMWTTAQEADNDYYKYGGCTAENNPWLLVMDYITKYDPYCHPATCHMENATKMRVKDSAFAKKEVHGWYAAQYSTWVSSGVNFRLMKDYWNNDGSKPVVNYEGRYDHFWGGTFVARSQGWIAYLNGQFGYGYGIQPIWSIVWADYGEKTATTDESGETYDRGINWLEGLYAEGGQQLIYMKELLEKYDWWELTPCFDSSDYFEAGKGFYSAAAIGNEVYIGYFFGSDTESLGVFLGAQDTEYNTYWFNCGTGEKEQETAVVPALGRITIPNKPDGSDWVYVAEIKK